jgi:hypothetical protein
MTSRSKRPTTFDVTAETKVSRELTPAPMSAGPFAPGADFSGLPVDPRPVPTAEEIRRQYHARIGFQPEPALEPWEVLLGD